MTGSETRPVGLDMGAVMMMAAARGADMALLSEILPRIEGAIVSPRTDEVGADDSEMEE